MTTRQLDLLDLPPMPVMPSDPHVAPEAIPRLSRQCREILDRLREGSATNVELLELAARFGARVHDLRQAGCVITTTHLGKSTGLVMYELKHEPAGLA